MHRKSSPGPEINQEPLTPISEESIQCIVIHTPLGRIREGSDDAGPVAAPRLLAKTSWILHYGEGFQVDKPPNITLQTISLSLITVARMEAKGGHTLQRHL